MSKAEFCELTCDICGKTTKVSTVQGIQVGQPNNHSICLVQDGATFRIRKYSEISTPVDVCTDCNNKLDDYVQDAVNYIIEHTSR